MDSYDSSFLTPAELVSEVAGPEETKNPAGESPPPDSNPFSDAEFEKISPVGQDNWYHPIPEMMCRI
jgi:hypothetical protein